MLTHIPFQAHLYCSMVSLIMLHCPRMQCKQVRAKAYESLTSYPPELLDKLEATPPLSHYVAPLATLPHSSHSLPDQTLAEPGETLVQGVAWEYDAGARAAAEKLAAKALEYEHANRRRFLVAGVGAGGGAGGVGGSKSEGQHEIAKDGGINPKATGSSGISAAAAAREASSLKHRLLSTLPPALTATASAASQSSAGSSVTVGPTRMHPHPGSLLLVSKPPAATSVTPPSATPTPAAPSRSAVGKPNFTPASAKAKQAAATAVSTSSATKTAEASLHEVWGQRLQAGLHGMGAAGLGTGLTGGLGAAPCIDQAVLSLSIRSWAVFFSK